MREYKMYFVVNSSYKFRPGFLAGQVAHATSLFLYHGYIKQDWHGLPELPSRKVLDHYFDTHITKIILSCPAIKMGILKSQGYLVIDDDITNNNRDFTVGYAGLYPKDEEPEWLQQLQLY